VFISSCRDNAESTSDTIENTEAIVTIKNGLKGAWELKGF